MEVDEAEPPQKEAIHLPAELILEILSYLPLTRPSTQHTLFNVCLVSNEWYQVAIARLYYQPYITGRNFDFFVRTLCPSVNAHVRKSDLAGLVHVLDLSRLVHHSTKSTTARLLGRTKPKLMWFKAPATSFGLNCFAALSKCRELRILDLSLVNDAISMHSLAQSLKSLPELQRLSLPRSSPRVEDFQASNFVFPRYLDVLTLQGGISDAFVKDLAEPLLRLGINDLTLNICHCPQVSSVGISDLIRPTQQMLHTLHISNLPSLGRGRFRSLLNFVLQECPLTELSVSSDYVSWELVWHNELFRRLLDPAYLDDPYDNSTARDPRRLAFDKWKTLQDKAIIGRYEAHPLKVLEITSSGDPIMEPDEMIRPGGEFNLTPTE